METQAGWQISQLKIKKKWIFPVSCSFFSLLSVLMTGCFLWQYFLPKLATDSLGPEATSAPVRMCPQHPEPVPLAHPLPVLKEALEKVDRILREALSAPGLAAISAVVVHNDTVLWTGNFGKKNGLDPASGPPNEYTMYRISSVSKIFPVLMLYRLWEEGIVASLDDPLERYASTFTINNPLGMASAPEQQSLMDGLGEVGPAPRPSPVTLRRMASQLSGLPRRLRSTSLLWRGSTQEALSLLQDDVLVVVPGTRCHYSTLAFSLLAHVLAAHTAQGDYQRWVAENVLEPLGMADTGFDLTPPVRARLAAGFYGSGRPAPLYDLGWYRPSGQMYSTAADLAKLATPRIEALVPPAFRTLALRHLRGRVFQLHVAREFPCALPLGDTWLSLEAQHGQLVNFYPLNRQGLSPGFDVPGLNTYRVLRLLRKPAFKTQ
ncbi:PREDICTED: putative beta-lactamase-like 1 [Miniopterus natalensis]|uniref:putative beta-lactamase-like 1 n=1 Tax=Miniopterus natalensis TaxID=291302 RepID=UPI0007A6B39C|nr:PREDICTED: putative beta-lactamase-like 1 [Miniopterus natalensis]